MNKTIIFFTIAIVISGQIVASDFFIKKEDIEKYGLIYNHLQPINLSPDGSYLVMSQAVEDIRLKAKGITRILRILRRTFSSAIEYLVRHCSQINFTKIQEALVL